MKDGIEKQKQIKRTIDKISYLKRMIYYTPIHLDKIYYEELLKVEENNLRDLREEEVTKTVSSQAKDITLTREELSEFDGIDGKPAYVAVKGLIYDVSEVPLWKGGSHFGLEAGKDLTNDYMNCHALTKTLVNLKPIGILIK